MGARWAGVGLSRPQCTEQWRVVRGQGAMLLNSGWHSPLVQDGEAGGRAASAWFGSEVTLEAQLSRWII